MKRYSILIVILLTNLLVFSQHSVDLEHQLYDITSAFDMNQKVIDTKIIEPANDYEVFHVNRFIKLQYKKLFKTTYQSLQQGKLKLNQVEAIYNKKYNAIINDPQLTEKFNAYMQEVESRITPVGSSPRGGSGNRTPGQACTNLDFEDGTWSSWDVFNGDACDGYVGCVTGMTPGTTTNGGFGGGSPVHLITNPGTGMDPDVPVSTVSPFGGTNSLRLGNLDAGDWAEAIENTFLVTADKPYFSYEYAVIIENPATHDPEEMPFFLIEFYDAANNTITDSCGNYYVDPSTEIAKTTFDSIQVGFSWWFYKDWARISVDLTPYIGQNVKIRFTTSDCTLGGHLGRAYLDASCHTAAIDVVQDCPGIRLQAPLGYFQYRWNTGNAADTLDYLYVPGPGNYNVDLISETGCVINVDTVVTNIYIKTGQNTTQVNETCAGSADGSITSYPYGGVLPYQFSIDNGATYQSSPTFNGLTAGSYDIILLDNNGCSDTAFGITITSPPALFPNLIITNASCNNICDGFAHVSPIGGTSPNGIYRVEWNGQNYNNDSIFNLCAKNYEVKVIDELGCAVTQTFPIIEPPVLTIDQLVIDDEVCYNNCDGRITISDVDATAYSIDGGFTWQTNNVFNNLCAQAAPYNATIRDSKGCKASQLVNMGQPLPLTINLSNDTTICLNKPAFLDANVVGGVAPITYQWSNGKSTQIIQESPKNYTIYSVVGQDANGCQVAGQTSISVFPQPIADFIFTPGPETDVFNTEVDFINASSSVIPIVYEWYIDNLDTGYASNHNYEFPSVGGEYYTNTLKIESQHGCRDSISKVLFINHETLVYVPNTFTPDDDGINDIFKPSIEGLEEEIYQLFIFNRWGDKIFETNSINKGWNGMHDGVKAQPSVYVWRVVSRLKSTGSDFEEFGHINLLR